MTNRWREKCHHLSTENLNSIGTIKEANMGGDKRRIAHLQVEISCRTKANGRQYYLRRRQQWTGCRVEGYKRKGESVHRLGSGGRDPNGAREINARREFWRIPRGLCFSFGLPLRFTPRFSGPALGMNYMVKITPTLLL
jgi:hypothetical protein